MEYRERHTLAQQLQDNAHLEADRELLKQVDPKNSLNTRVAISPSLSFEVVFALLKFVSVDQIKANRNAAKGETKVTRKKDPKKKNKGQKTLKKEAKATEVQPEDKKKADEVPGVPEDTVGRTLGSDGTESRTDLF